MALTKDSKSSVYRCKECGLRFDSLGDMQRHMTVEHLQRDRSAVT